MDIKLLSLNVYSVGPQFFKMVTVYFVESIAENKAKGLFQMLRSTSSPKIYMQFYVYDGLVKKVLYASKE